MCMAIPKDIWDRYRERVNAAYSAGRYDIASSIIMRMESEASRRYGIVAGGDPVEETPVPPATPEPVPEPVQARMPEMFQRYVRPMRELLVA